MSKNKPLVINLIGGPGSGKSTTMAGVFCERLKNHGMAGRYAYRRLRFAYRRCGALTAAPCATSRVTRGGAHFHSHPNRLLPRKMDSATKTVTPIRISFV